MAKGIADRRLGIGCDQILIIEPATEEGADVFMRILNADGGEVDACGNGTRCVAALVMGLWEPALFVVGLLVGMWGFRRLPA